MTHWKPLLSNSIPSPETAAPRPASAPSVPGSTPSSPPVQSASPIHRPNRLRPEQLQALYANGETQCLIAIFVFDALLIGTGGTALWVTNSQLFVMIVVYAFLLWLFSLLSQRMFYWYVFGNSIRITESQYPEIHVVVKQAADALSLTAVPTIFILQGHGLVNTFVAKHFSRRGMIILTSNLVDELVSTGDTRRLMMVVGRQLGHIAAKHFDWWFLKDVLGSFTIFLYTAYRRRCHYTADRIGLMIAGDLTEARAGLLVLTVGKTLAPQTNPNELAEQCSTLQESFLAWVRGICSTYPYMILRLAALNEFHSRQQHAPLRDVSGSPVVSFNIYHPSIGNLVVGDGASATAY